MFWPHSLSHKQAHTTDQQEDIHITVQAHTPHTNPTMTRPLKELIIICVTLIIGLSLIPHQPQLPHPQHIFPHNNQTQKITPYSDPLSPRRIHPFTNTSQDMTPQSDPLTPIIPHMSHTHNKVTPTHAHNHILNITSPLHPNLPYNTTITIPTHNYNLNYTHQIHNTTIPITYTHINHQHPYNTNTSHTHYHPYNHQQKTHNYPLIFINALSYIGHIYYITHTHKQKPKIKPIKYYTWNNSTLISLHGDIHPNPGPMSITHITKNFPQDFTQRQRHYFIPNTTTLKPPYTHLEKLFSIHLNQNAPQQELNNIHRHNSILSQHPLHFQIYALIIAYGPTPQICDHQMAEELDPRCLTILNKLKELPESTPTHIQRLHTLNHPTPPTTITQAYSHINKLIAKGEVINMATLKQNIPHIPHQILLELIKCTHKVHGYHPTHDTTHTIPSPNTNTNNDNHQTSALRIITWNTGCISSSLPGIQELARTIHKDPHIILIQETKLHKLKSTTYIDKKFPNYKIIYNNSNTTIPNPNRYSGDNPARGGTLTMIPKIIHTNDNITKIPTPTTISPYLQVIKIQNKPITPILLINMYMPTHPQDLHLIQEIQNHIQTIVQNHSTFHIILGGDFKRDILLKGRSSNGITSPPNPHDHEWAHFTQRLGLKTINNQDIYTRQGGHNYTATSHIDGFYSNLPNHASLQSHTLTNLNQNSDHYPVHLQLAPNTIIIKTKTTPNTRPL